MQAVNNVCILSNSRPSRDLHKDVKDPAVEIWRWRKADKNNTLLLRTACSYCMLQGQGLAAHVLWQLYTQRAGCAAVLAEVEPRLFCE